MGKDKTKMSEDTIEDAYWLGKDQIEMTEEEKYNEEKRVRAGLCKAEWADTNDLDRELFPLEADIQVALKRFRTASTKEKAINTLNSVIRNCEEMKGRIEDMWEAN